ncbi:Hypothetical protein CpE7_0880 [Corynebacterium pseudotuberculosis]|nr:Hypothetical protein CpE7_0880 [Corynebacterium pseudotuberculosis]
MIVFVSSGTTLVQECLFPKDRLVYKTKGELQGIGVFTGKT